MITKTIEKTIKSTVYEATDGTQFQSAAECEKYEETAKCALLTRYKDLILKSLSEYDLSGFGNDDYIIDIVEIKSIEDLNLILQLFNLFNNDCPNKDKESLIMNAFEDKGKLCIGRGYPGEDGFWPVSTEQRIIKKIKNSFNT